MVRASSQQARYVARSSVRGRARVSASVGTLRRSLLTQARGLLQDAVLTGHDGDEVGALAWLHADHTHRCDAAGHPDAGLRRSLQAAMDRLASGAGSSQRVERLLLLTEAPVPAAGEITDKGYVNQRAVRERRSDLVAALHAEPHQERVVLRV